MFLCTISAQAADLVAYYPLDGDAKDKKNGNHGKIEGKSKWVDGKFGKAIDLDPKSFINIPASKTLHGDLFVNAFTLSAWIKPNFKGSAWEHIWRSLPTGSGHNTLFINKDSGLVSWRGMVGGGWTVMCQTDGGLIEENKWYNVTMTSDKKKFRIYLNGSKVKETDHKVTDGGIETYHLGGEGGETYAGLMDDAAVFSGAMEESTISKIQKDSIGAVVMSDTSVDSKAKLATTWANLKRL